MSNNKTRTDLLFEAYLKYNKIDFKYEPFSNDNYSSPDYLLETSIGKILVEVKEIELSPILRFKVNAMSNGQGTIVQDEYYKKIRKEINEASRQLKQHISKADFAIIIFGFSYPFDKIDVSDFFGALYGDPYVTINSGGVSKLDYKINGALRKNIQEGPILKKYISAFGLIIDSRLLKDENRKFASIELLDMDKHNMCRGVSPESILNTIHTKWINVFGEVSDSNLLLQLFNYKSGNNPLIGYFDKLCKYKI